MRLRQSSRTSLEEITAQPDERVSHVITDEYVAPTRETFPRSMRGALARYARAELREQEKGAWERAAAEKYGTILYPKRTAMCMLLISLLTARA